jgi:outer membrane protein assembly factor BamB
VISRSSSRRRPPVLSGGIVFVALTGGQLVALDAQTGRRLWVSTALGLIHWESPVVADGTVYCSDQSGALTAFALAAHPR